MVLIGLRLALTLYGVFDIIVPEVLRTYNSNTNGVTSLISLLLSVQYTCTSISQHFHRTKRKVLKHFKLLDSPFLHLPLELRERVYELTCVPNSDGTITGVHHLLLLNKQIRREALPFYNRISHRIVVGDLEEPQSPIEYKGLPYLVKDEWFMVSIKHLVIEVSVCSLGLMTPDCFDVNISKKGKDQWRSLKKLIGIWPEVREEPLQSIRLDLKRSKREGSTKGTYRADFIRIIRNFKRTRIWAEAGNCADKDKRKYVLLPLVRAFNQGRRNWVTDSEDSHNLIVRYDKQVLPESISIGLAGMKENDSTEDLEKWNVVPTADTSRTDNASWPEWTEKEEKYVREKMIPRKMLTDREWECKRCLAVFDCPRESREHRIRGVTRSTL